MDWKSKLPSLEELGSVGLKLIKDAKKSVCEVIDDYKKKHPDEVKSEKKPKKKEKVKE